ncbi:PIN domain-containing protein [Streptomyces sp. NPDC058620]|uniref:PIN domain-containing protein n=1 Tax=Streptomyces sp. NPDC058620 TaxID=3346560 RepID=UPI003662C6E9
MYQRGPLRRALLDTSVLTTDIIAATRRRDPSSFVAGGRAGTVRCLIPVHVWEEVPRVLADRHREGGKFDLGRALALWKFRYAPVLYVVDTAGLPMTPEAQVLAGRDASDVPMLLLAGVIAPVVIIGTDADLVDSGLAVKEWRELRSALGDVGVTEGKMIDLERQTSVFLNITEHRGFPFCARR